MPMDRVHTTSIVDSGDPFYFNHRGRAGADDVPRSPDPAVSAL
jgi:hypothetical protein